MHRGCTFVLRPQSALLVFVPNDTPYVLTATTIKLFLLCHGIKYIDREIALVTIINLSALSKYGLSVPVEKFSIEFNIELHTLQ